MTQYKEIYKSAFTNTAIGAGDIEYYGADVIQQQKRDKYGSSNTLSLVSVDVVDYEILLDGINSVGFLYSRSFFVIPADDGTYFNFVVLKNNSSGTSGTAGAVKIKIGLSVPIPNT